MDELLIEQVEAYLANRLSTAERTEFEQRLKSDAQFLAEVRPLMTAELAARLQAMADQDSRFQRYYEEAKANKGTERPTIRPMYIALAVAAAIALIFVLVWPPFSQNTQLSSQELYAEHFEPYLPPETRSTEVSVDSALQLAHMLILNKEYEPGAARLQSILDTAQLDTQRLIEEQLFLSSAYMSHGAYEAALQVLETVSVPEKPEVLWYRALCLIQLDRIAEAEPLLAQLSSMNAPYYGDKARALAALLP